MGALQVMCTWMFSRVHACGSLPGPAHNLNDQNYIVCKYRHGLVVILEVGNRSDLGSNPSKNLRSFEQKIKFLRCHYYVIITSLLRHYYIIITSLLHHYYIIVTHYYNFIITYYYIIISTLLHHYYSLLQQHYYILLRHYCIIITSLLRHYYIIITSLLHHYYIIITSLLLIITGSLLHIITILLCQYDIINIKIHYYIINASLLHHHYVIITHYYYVI